MVTLELLEVRQTLVSSWLFVLQALLRTLLVVVEKYYDGENYARLLLLELLCRWLIVGGYGVVVGGGGACSLFTILFSELIARNSIIIINFIQGFKG